MKVELNKDPLFEVNESPLKAIKQKQLERQKQLRHQRNHPTNKKKQRLLDIIDPLPIELNNYKAETSYKTSVQSSKASESLKKYVIEQQKNLRCLRLEKLSNNEEKLSTSRLKSLKLNVSQIEEQDKNSKQIHIPRIEDMFKNQSKEILIYENTTLRDRIGKMITTLDGQIGKFKSLSYAYAKPDESVVNSLQTTKLNIQNSEDDYQIDKIIERKLKKSEELQRKLYKQKKEMAGKQPGESSETKDNSNMSYFLRVVEKPRRKELLKGIKYYSYKNGNKRLELTSASGLLFEMHKLSNEKDKKQYQLNGLLKNSFQNRDNILKEKEVFYETQNPFEDLSPSKQFQLRKVMNKKLNHRLQISKQQVNKFIKYLSEIKDYHVILNETILQILKEVREGLLKGKVMKMSDLNDIMKDKKDQDLKGYPNQLIVRKLAEMMI